MPRFTAGSGNFPGHTSMVLSTEGSLSPGTAVLFTNMLPPISRTEFCFYPGTGRFLLQAYRLLYPEERAHTVYAYWSRLAAGKLTAQYYKQDYFRRFLYHKVNQGFTIRQVLLGMELPDFVEPLCRDIQLRPDEKLTNKMSKHSRLSDRALGPGAGTLPGAAAGRRSLLRDAAAGMQASGGRGHRMGRQRPIDAQLRRQPNLESELPHHRSACRDQLPSKPGAGGCRALLAGGQLVSYLYSQGKPGPLECPRPGARSQSILGAPVERAGRQLTRILSGRSRGIPVPVPENRAAPEQIRQIHRGILDFVRQFLEAERQLGFQLPIRGRDAYAPMRSVCSPQK